MKKKTGLIIGIALLCIAIASVLFLQGKEKPTDQTAQVPKEIIEVVGSIGSEKAPFHEDEEVKKILHEKYGIVVNWKKEGSFEMVQGDTSGLDFLFPSSQVAYELFKNEHGELVKANDVIFNSPIVLYSWQPIGEALVDQGVAKKETDIYYTVDTNKLFNLVMEGKKWSDIGISELYGQVQIISTHPNKSNSGNMMAGLLANVLNNGELVSPQQIPTVLPKVQHFFATMGYMEHSSGDLFQQYLRMGIGAKPMIAGYENQLIEFAVENQELLKKTQAEMIVLYPTPTVWSSHPFIALTDNGKKLLTALQDKEIQELAWKKHGFRTGATGIENNPNDLIIQGLPETIKSVMPMPSPDVMETIANSIQ